MKWALGRVLRDARLCDSALPTSVPASMRFPEVATKDKDKDQAVFGNGGHSILEDARSPRALGNSQTCFIPN
jgi:hypothetical protein